MIDIKTLVRENISKLKSYSSARDEYSGTEGIFLDANENPFGKLNRYPDPYQQKLKDRLSLLKNIPSKNIFIGNGSDEIIDLVFRVFCEPGLDKIITFSPTYGMYEVSAAINNVEVVGIALTTDFQINFESFFQQIESKEHIKVVFICSPNNPTGNSINDIDRLLKKTNVIVVVDEAYIDFSNRASFLEKVNEYPNLVVLQTFSKAFGLAAARVGVAYANEAIIELFNKVKPPYNVSALNQNAAFKAIDDLENIQNTILLIIKEKKRILNALIKLNLVIKIYPSDANFFLVELKNAQAVYKKLIKKDIIIRNRCEIIKNCVRITIGAPEENNLLLKEIKKLNE